MVPVGSHPRERWEALVHGLSDRHLIIYIYVVFSVAVAGCPMYATKAAKAVPNARQMASAALHDASEQHTGARSSVAGRNNLCLEYALVLRCMVGSRFGNVYRRATAHVLALHGHTSRTDMCRGRRQRQYAYIAPVFEYNCFAAFVGFWRWCPHEGLFSSTSIHPTVTLCMLDQRRKISVKTTCCTRIQQNCECNTLWPNCV